MARTDWKRQEELNLVGLTKERKERAELQLRFENMERQQAVTLLALIDARKVILLIRDADLLPPPSQYERELMRSNIGAARGQAQMGTPVIRA